MWPGERCGLRRASARTRPSGCTTTTPRARPRSHDADVHDHPAVGPPDEAVQSLPAGGEHDLADRRAGGETAEAERDQGNEATRHRTRRRSRRRRCRSRRATAAGAASSSPDALRHGSAGATAMRKSSAMPIGIVIRSKYGRPIEMRSPFDGLEDQREHGAEQHDERERGEQHVVGEERALTRDRASRSSRATADDRPATR